MEGEVDWRAVLDMEALEAILCTGHHKTRLTGGQIINDIDEADRCVLDGDSQIIALIHEQRLWIGSEGRSVCAGRSWRASWNAIHLDKGEVGRLCASGIAELEAERALQTVDVQRSAPVSLIATDLGNER